MALDENAKSANVVGSIQRYLHDALADVLNSSAPALDFGGGMAFQDTALAEWVQIRTMGVARPDTWSGPFAGRASGGFPDTRGQELLWLLNVNCFVRPEPQRSGFSNLRIYQVRDLVLEALAVGTRIRVKDYTDPSTLGQETVGYLFVHEVMADRPIDEPTRTELVQHNLVFALRWLETWTA